MITVYILYSEVLGKFYIGQTIHLDLRIEEHNRGKGSFTSQANDWIVVYKQEVADRKLATALEKKIKSRGAKRFIEGLQSNG